MSWEPVRIYFRDPEMPLTFDRGESFDGMRYAWVISSFLMVCSQALGRRRLVQYKDDPSARKAMAMFRFPVKARDP